jgi:hypothetical protein
MAGMTILLFSISFEILMSTPKHDLGQKYDEPKVYLVVERSDMQLEKRWKRFEGEKSGERHDLERLLSHAIMTTFSRVLAWLI